RAAGTGLFCLRPQLGLPQRRTVGAQQSWKTRTVNSSLIHISLLIDRQAFHYSITDTVANGRTNNRPTNSFEKRVLSSDNKTGLFKQSPGRLVEINDVQSVVVAQGFAETDLGQSRVG